MHPPVGPAILVWLETSGLATLMRQSQWLYPIVEIVHIVGFVTLVGSVAMFDLRLLGLSPKLPVSDMARHLLRWSLWSLVLILPTGFAMFAAHATEFAENPAFLLKLARRRRDQCHPVPPDVVPLGGRLEHHGDATGLFACRGRRIAVDLARCDLLRPPYCLSLSFVWAGG